MPFIKNIVTQASRSYSPYIPPPPQYSVWGWGGGEFGQIDNDVLISNPYKLDNELSWVSGSATLRATMAIKTNGTLWGTGLLIGDNTTINKSSPVQIGTRTGWLNVYGGHAGSIFAIRTDQSLWSWGSNNQGELGTNDNASKSSPVQIGTLTNWSSVFPGALHTIAIKTDKTLWAWGLNQLGQLGDLTTTGTSSPIQIGTDTNWLLAAGGDNHTLALKTDYTLWSWGGAFNVGTIPLSITPTPIDQNNWWNEIAAGSSITFGIKTDGTMWSAGVGNAGQLGQLIPVLPVRIDNNANWSKISTGGSHTIAIKTDGTLWGWGLNGNGQIGDGTFVTRSSPVQIGTDNNWSTISSNYNNSAGIKTNGTLWIWGWNFHGILGQNNTISRSSPVQVGTTNDWSKVALGVSHILAIKTNGTLWSWGNNSVGQLGQNNTISRSSPIQIGTLTGWSEITAATHGDVAGIGSHSMAIRTNGSLWGWGTNSSGQLGTNNTTTYSSPVQIGTLTDWYSVNAGNIHTLAIKTNGTLWSWGNNSYGNLGQGDSTNRSSPTQIGVLNNWSNVSTGEQATIARKIDGTLWAWGINNVGQVGDGTTTFRNSPVQVGLGIDWSSNIGAGVTFVGAISTSGGIWLWGGNATGQLGINNTFSVLTNSAYPFLRRIGNDSNWSAVEAGGVSAVAKKTNGTLWSWGNNTAGQLGLNDVTTRWSPVQIGNDTDWNVFSLLTSHTMAIKTDGTLWGWGINGNGELGNEPITPTRLNVDSWSETDAGFSYTMGIKSNGTLWGWGLGTSGQLGVSAPIIPYRIGNLSDWSSISAGGTFTLGIKTNGTLWGWGSNIYGQLGDTTFINRSSPVQIGTSSDWFSVSSGLSHSAAIKTNGTIWTWGLGSNGELGNNSILITANTPINVGTLTNWARVSVGYSHTMAIKTDGTLWGWGANSAGQLGDGTVINRSSPVQIGTLTGWSKIVAGSISTYSIRTDGSLWAWGWNANGQLGDNTVIARSSPVQIGTLTTWNDVSQGNVSTLAIQTNGTIWSWGNNFSGQLGLNDTVNRSSPVQIGTLTSWSRVSTNGASIAIRTDGTLWGWGVNLSGAVGDETLVNKSSPVQIGTLTGWSAISSGGSHTIALIGNSLYGWGENELGQVGLNHTLRATTLTSLIVSSPTQIGTETNWSKVSTANAFTIARRTDGTLWSWGNNQFGQLGLNDTRNRWSPVQIGTGTDWFAISSFNSYTMAIKTNGTLWGWGQNTSGGIGDNTNVDRSSPVQVGTLNGWIDVSAGLSHTMAVRTNGTLWVWGSNLQNQLGDGSVSVVRSSPVQIGTLTNWSKVSAGTSHSMAIKTDGTLWAWGGNNSGELGRNTSVTSINSPVQVGTLTDWSNVWAVNARTYATKTDGTLWGWGTSTNYLGDTVSVPINRSSPVQIGILTNWYEIGRGQNHITALKTNGTMWGWGINAQGQLGLNFINSNTNRSSPVQIGDDAVWSRISTGANHTLSVKTDGTLWGWGGNGFGQIGDASSTSRSYPVQIGTRTGWSKVSAGLSHSMGIRTDGTLWGWGGDGSGEVGYRGEYMTPKFLSGGWSVISAGIIHIQAIKTDGTLWAWGGNSTAVMNGALGDNTIINRSSPVQIGTGMDWVVVSTGLDNQQFRPHSLAIKTNGTLWAWGANTFGQFGNNTNSNRSSPVQIGTLSDWSAVEAATNFSIALKTNGTLWSWGSNGAGQLGLNSSTSSTSSPIQIGTLSDWSKISARGNASLAIKTNGTLWGWGSNNSGQVGDGTTSNRSSPVQIGTLTDWSYISTGTSYSMAIRSNGTLWAWGGNASGELGLGTSGSSVNTPTQVGVLTNWSKVSAGFSHTMAIKTDGTLWGWGVNSDGRIGDGTNTSRNSPVQIGTLTNWSNVSAGFSHTIAINTSGDIYLFGGNSTGQLGFNTTIGGQTTAISSPIQIGTNTNWADVWATANRTYATKTDGTLWGWGAATNYLGDELSSNLPTRTFPTLPTTRYSPVQIGTNTNWYKIGRGNTHIVGLKTNGSFLGWGPDTSGELGQGVISGQIYRRSSPTQIGEDKYWLKISTGMSHTIAVKSDGTLWGWGTNTNGQVGDNSTTIKQYPVQIGTLTTWASVSAGRDSSFAIKTDGTLWGWGLNSSGQLGDGTFINRSSPVQIGTRTDWKESSFFMSTGSHTVFVTSDNSLFTWGAYTTGQLGYSIQRSSPVQIGNLIDWSTIDAGDLAFHTISVKTDGTLWGWGANNFGQLGDNTVVYKGSPVQIGTRTGWSSVNLSLSHTMAIRTDYTLWGWGRNVSGQIGDGTATDRSSPVQIGTTSDWSKVSAGGNADGTMFSMAIKTDGSLWGWGSFTNGKIGIILPYIPQRVGTDSNWSIVSNNRTDTIDAGFSLGVKTDGTIWGWGLNSSGQLGLNDVINRNSPVQIGTLTNWSSVASGRSHTIALKSDGTLWAWGGNSVAGELGDGTTSPKSSPIQIGTLTGWARISVGMQTSHAIRTDGTLWGWGFGAAGRIGDNNTLNRLAPVQIGTLTNWASISNSSSHSMAIKTDGTLWGWGQNGSGQIGDGTVISRSSPVQIGTLTNWSKISTQGNVSIAIKTDGTLWGWGTGGRVGDSTSISRSSPVQIGTLTSWTDTFSGESVSFATRTDGTLWGWGAPTRGQLGTGYIDQNGFSPITSPVQIDSTISWSTINKTNGGGISSLAIDSVGRLYAWGLNSNGELGLGNNISFNSTIQATPGRVQIGTNWSTLSLGADHGMATKTDGTLWGWGVNGAGQIGDRTVTTRSSPIQIGTLTGWSKVSAGVSHTMAIYTDNTLWAWGLGTSGQLGYDTIVPSRLTPTNDWSDVAAGTRHSVAIKSNGTIWSWGSNNNGQLGDNTVTTKSSPIQIGTLTNWSKVVAGGVTGTLYMFTMAIKTDGTLWGWGNNNVTGQLGDGTLTNRSSPVQVGTLTDWSNVYAGGFHTIAIKTNGTLWGWGQLNSNGSDVFRTSPVQIGTLTDWVDVGTGASHTIAVRSNGTLWGWGLDNTGGQIGDRTTVGSKSSPIQIGTLTNWSKVSAGAFHSMAIKTDGTLWSWGLGTSGQLGDGTSVSKSSPVQVGTLTDWSDVFGTPSSDYSFALKTDGTLWGWGLNTNAELGLNDKINRSSPIQIGTRTNWLKIAPGGSHSIAIKSDSSLWGWGLTTTGQLARNVADAITSLSSPIQIGEDQWSNVYAGNTFTLAIKTNGTLWAWGVNTAGFLGDSSILSRSAPVQIGSRSGWTQVSAGASHTIAIRQE